MPAGNLARRFVCAKVLPTGRVCGAVLATLFFFLLPVAAQTPEPLKTDQRARPKVITNKELEPSRLRREAQEAEYDRTHRERGMPSRQELQRYFEELDRKLHESALRFEEERAEAEAEALKSELDAVKRKLYELSLSLSRQPGAYVPVYVSPNYSPYYYAPPVRVFTRFLFSRHGGFVFHQGDHWRGRTFPSPGGAPLYKSTPPRAPAIPVTRR